jgi:transcriptional regulator with XRE-family HTH domain
MPRTETSELAAQLVGYEIRRARKAAGLTQAEVAKRLELTVPYVSNVEAGRVNLTVGQLARFADALGSDLRLSLPRIEIRAPAITAPGASISR